MKKHWIIFSFALLSSLSSISQSSFAAFDAFGSQYNLEDLNISSARSAIITSTCGSGYFIACFEQGSFWDGNVAAQNVLCRLLGDLSNLIASPLSTNPTVGPKIRLSCGSTPSTSPNSLALATAFYVFPLNAGNPNQGIIDNQIQKMLISGIDSYSNVPSSFQNGSVFYHGYIDVNPTPPSGNTWNLNLTNTSVSNNEVDLYSVLLHEMLHALGFASLIGSNGNSTFGAANNYFSRYDRYLVGANGTRLISSTTPSCINTNVVFTSSLVPIIASATAGCLPDITNCLSAIHYSSTNVNVPVYTPNCFEAGGSLSHFEDICPIPSTVNLGCATNTNSTLNNNKYYVMSNGSGPGTCYVKRFPKEQERTVLCDIGYSLSAVYGSTVAGSNITYSGSCAPINVWGLNDGLTNGVITNTAAPGVTLITIPIGPVLANDSPNTSTLSCLEVIQGGSVATASISGSNIIITNNTSTPGLIILKYLPRDALGNFGWPTYIFAYFTQAGCGSLNVCSLVQNGNFESGTTCGLMTPTNNIRPTCWSSLNYPGYLVRNCTSNGGAFNLGTNTYGSPTTADSFNGAQNNAIVSIANVASTGTALGFGFLPSWVSTDLSSALIPQQVYQVSLWAYHPFMPAAPNSTLDNSPIIISLYTAPNQTSIWPFNVLASFTLNSTDMWTSFTNTFVFSPTVGHSHLKVSIDPYSPLISTVTPVPSALTYLAFIDEVSITSVSSPTFVIPSATTICGPISFTNLAQYATPVTGGVFSGQGVSATTTSAGTQYNFSSFGLAAGQSYPIAFIYTLSGCSYTLWQSVPVQQGINPGMCNDGFTLSALGFPSGTTFTWQPGGSNSATFTAHPSSATVYSLSSSSGTCQLLNTVSVSPCCPISVPNPLSGILSNTLSGSASFVGNITVPSGTTATLKGDFLCGPNVKITVEPGAYLKVLGSHLHACGSIMWQGIVVKDGGKVLCDLDPSIFDRESLIEDAITGIDASNQTNSTLSAIITVSNTTFNKNYIGINISNYNSTNLSTYPFIIQKCTFTSRTYTASSTNWVQNTDLNFVSTGTGLSSPFLLGGAPVSSLKVPYATQPSQIAIRLNAVGNTMFSTIFGITVRNTIFDAHNTCINALNSNLFSYNNIFQNTQVTNGLPGKGISSVNDYNSGLYSYNLSLTAPSSPATNRNRFFDCHTAVNAVNLEWLDIQYAEFKSTQNISVMPSPTSKGLYGIYIISNKFNAYEISRNTFLNVSNCIYGVATANVIHPLLSPSYGQLWGTFRINNNLFSATPSNNEFINNSILIENLSMTTPNGFMSGGTLNGLLIQYNDFANVWRGVQIRNFDNSLFNKITANNTFTLVADITSSNPQWGVNYSHNKTGIINQNRVIGFGTNTVSATKGIYCSLNGNIGVGCNSLVTLPVGTEFAGTNAGTNWWNNTMNNNARGMQLSSSGIIGQQGSYNAPRDNIWQAAWTGNNFNTYTADNATFASNSPLWRRTLSGYDPLNNSGAPFPQSYGFAGALQTSYNYGASPNCIPLVPARTLDWNGSKKSLFISIFSRTINHGGNNTDATQEIDDLEMYRSLYQDTTLRECNDTLLAFYNANKNSSLGALIDIEKKLETHNLPGANAALGAFSPSTNIQQNYVDFYTFYSDYLADGILTAANLSNLELLAGKCPFIAGPVVYNARALYNIALGKSIVYNDDACEIGNSARNANLQTENFSLLPSYELFPNPADDEIQISGSVEKGILQVEIHDLTFKLLLKSVITVSNNKANLRFNLLNGVYLITIINQNNEHIIKKLVISK